MVTRIANNPLAATCLLVIAFVPPAAGDEPPEAIHDLGLPAVSIQDPKGSLDPFFDGLAELEEKKSDRLVRAVFFGSSEIGYDRVTSQMRRRLQARFGDGGKGFVIVAPGFRHTRHQDVIWRQEGWQGFSVRFGRRPDGRYGYGGNLAVFEPGSEEPGAWASYQTVAVDAGREAGYHPFPSGSRFSRFALWYQAHSGGGSLEIRIDPDGPAPVRRTISTRAEEARDRVFRTEVPDGPHQVMLTAAGDGALRLYGVVMERDRGFVLDAAMVVGAWGRTHLHFDPAHLKKQMRTRGPDLVIFQYGAKEVFKVPDLDEAYLRGFVRDFAQSAKRTLAGVPKASCLIVSSKDMGVRRGEQIVTRPALKKVVRGAEEVADRTGCAFFNLFQAMGGEGSLEQWWRHEPRLVSPDLGHYYDAGAIQVGDILTDALLEAYRKHRHPVAGDNRERASSHR